MLSTVSGDKGNRYAPQNYSKTSQSGERLTKEQRSGNGGHNSWLFHRPSLSLGFVLLRLLIRGVHAGFDPWVADDVRLRFLDARPLENGSQDLFGLLIEVEFLVGVVSVFSHDFQPNGEVRATLDNVFFAHNADATLLRILL
jgi:hypothetical protein